MGDLGDGRQQPYAEVDEVLRRVRQIDPEISREAVARYVREIDELARAMSGLELDLDGHVCSYSPEWRENGGER